jgi:hypothetical protein
MTNRVEHLLSILSVAVFLGIAGCGKSDLERHAAQGAVLFDGQPMKSGMIRFIPTGDAKGPAAVAVITNGFYEVSRKHGPVAGLHRIEIEGQLETRFEIDDERAFAKAVAETKGKPLPPQPVPPQYNLRSTLTAEVSTDDAANKFDFDLQLQRSAKKR